MRTAEVQDAWRRTLERDRGFQFVDFSATGKRPFNDVQFDFCNGMTIVCGLNGVGKTTLLRLIETALTGGSAERPLRDNLLDEGDLTVRWTLDGHLHEAALDGEFDVDAHLLDSAEMTAALLAEWRQENFDDLLEGLESWELTDDDLGEISYLIGRTYDHVAVREFEPAYVGHELDTDRVLPFFDVRSLDLEYTSLDMGLGELAAMTLWWALRQVQPSSFVLVEEPETFLSSRSAISFLNLLSKAIDTRRLCAAVTTHSADLVAHAPLDTLRLLTFLPGDWAVSVRRPETKAELEATLGVSAGRTRVVFVEDPTARTFVVEVMAAHGGLWASTVEVLIAGDAERVVMLCGGIPESTSIRVVGVLDGDLRHRAEEFEESIWPVVFIPGESDPNTVLRNAAIANVDVFAGSLERSTESIGAALEPVAGNDPHDWFPNLARILGTDESAVIRAGIRCLEADDTRRDELLAFVEELATHVFS